MIPQWKIAQVCVRRFQVEWQHCAVVWSLSSCLPLFCVCVCVWEKMFWACRGAELPAASSCLLNHTLHTLHSSDSYWHTAYVLCPPSFTPSLLHSLSVPVSSFRCRDSGSWLISVVFRIHLPPFTIDLKRQFTQKVILYSPSSLSKLVCFSDFFRTQKADFEIFSF